MERVSGIRAIALGSVSAPALLRPTNPLPSGAVLLRNVFSMLNCRAFAILRYVQPFEPSAMSADTLTAGSERLGGTLAVCNVPR